MPCTYCGKDDKRIVKGLCWACYYRQRNTGSLEYKRVCHLCAEAGCVRPVVSHGLCDMHRNRLRKHGHTEATRPADWGERSGHPLYKLWAGMRRRCEDRNSRDFVNYGARGVKVCERWQDFWSFVADIGQRPSPRHSVDRINVHGDYCPENCRWATTKEQARNRRKTVITAESAAEIKRRAAAGETAGNIARSIGIKYDSVRCVIIGKSWA